MEDYWEVRFNKVIPSDETVYYSWVCMGLKVAIVEHFIWILENSRMISEIVR